MKKVLPIFVSFGILLVAIACQPKATETTETASQPEANASFSDLKVAYVYTDSVISKYEYFKAKSEELTEKGKKFEGDLQSRARGFEQEVANFQQTGGNMTPNQQRAKQEELLKKEQNLMTYRDNLMQELATDESSLYSEVYDKVQAYLKKYAEEQGLDLILSYTRGGAVWYGKGALDLTEEVVTGLNEEYASSTTTEQ
ncbi:OmpH family outer membrane protein [Algoriphagus limi]|uniref:OmpH family outer membrane protein n=1 Tax=Algoriphagus limi TaxID=2975273 RepID=A0ABT2G3C7_9BACT|nr:OmpH family outer membrane protein [Algoriphagus limi]